MHRTLLKSKIHRATITGADLHYEGSVTIDRDLMDAADLVAYEQVEIYNITSGTRLSTYVISGPRACGEICINGAAAHLMRTGELVIIASYVQLSEEELSAHEPRVVHVDESNVICRAPAASGS